MSTFLTFGVGISDLFLKQTVLVLVFPRTEDSHMLLLFWRISILSIEVRHPVLELCDEIGNCFNAIYCWLFQMYKNYHARIQK